MDRLLVGPVGPLDEQTASLADSLTRRLEELILDGTLKPGRRIPSERQLAERLKVSRNILREALKTLRGRGLIETRHGQGSVIAGLVPQPDQQNPLTLLYREHSRVLYDLLEVREILEGRAAFLAAERATEVDLRKLTLTFKSLEDTGAEHIGTDEDARRDHAFHQSIYEASHNPVLVHTLESLLQPMRHSVVASVKNLYHRSASKKQIDYHHRKIYNAIMGRHPGQAEKAAIAHIRDVRTRLQDIEKAEQRLDRSVSWERVLET